MDIAYSPSSQFVIVDPTNTRKIIDQNIQNNTLQIIVITHMRVTPSALLCTYYNALGDYIQL